MENPKERLLKALDDEQLNHVTGGSGNGTPDSEDTDSSRCPRCKSVLDHGICPNLRCRLYGSYCR